MLFDTRATQAGQASLDALWMKTQVIANNLANVDTPGFKASSVSFEETLRSTTARVQNKLGQQVDGGAASKGGASFQARVSTNEDASVRLDGNNVVLEKEQTELWKTYAQYSYLMDRISGHYQNINSAINSMKG